MKKKKKRVNLVACSAAIDVPEGYDGKIFRRCVRSYIERSWAKHCAKTKVSRDDIDAYMEVKRNFCENAAKLAGSNVSLIQKEYNFKMKSVNLSQKREKPKKKKAVALDSKLPAIEKNAGVKETLAEHNIKQYEKDYEIISLLSLPKSDKDWVETTRYELQDKATKYEKIMGEYLSNKGILYIHQMPFVFETHKYFVDFYLPNKRVAIEIDGSYHDSKSQVKYDAERDRLMRMSKIEVIRIKNQSVKDEKYLNSIILPKIR